MKIIALHILGNDTPLFVEAFQYKKDVAGDTCVVITTADRSNAMQFYEAEAEEVQRTLHISIAKYVADGSVMMYKVFKQVCSVLIEDAVIRKPIIVKLTKIRRIENPDVQTQGFVQRIDDWMKQWTVENNYKMMLVTDPKDALRVWWKEFHRLVSGMFASSVKNLNIAEQFSFEYQICEIKEDGSFWPSGSSRRVDMAEFVKEEEDAKQESA